GTDASDIDSVGDDLIVESVHDSDSEYSSEDDDDADVVSEAEEATEESELDEPLEAEVEVEEVEVEVKNEESEEEQEELESEAEEEEFDDAENVEVVEEEEVLAEAAALHYVEPAKVAAKFEELSKTMDTPFDQFFESISTPESGSRSLIFAIVMLITVMGAGFGHYIGACLIGHQPAMVVDGSNGGGPFCYESDRITTTTPLSSLPPFLMQQSGLHKLK
uniref:Uncharacterized protein n=1 Tax=Panagrolaimus sp. ES5 TaxID=591445 RepID=A0AC34GFI8_9BILA